MSKELIIATRGSKLALWQADYVARQLSAIGFPSQQKIVSTKGDRVQDRFLHEIGGKGVFVRELETVLQDGEADLAVHSLKDLPAVLPPGFVLAAILPRHSVHDALIFPDGSDVRAIGLPTTGSPPSVNGEGMSHLRPLRIGTASLRRSSLIKRFHPKLATVGVRGNVDTRLKKLNDGAFDALILAEASLERLALNPPYVRLSPEDFVPCAAQGALAIETVADAKSRELLAKLDCSLTRQAVELERKVLALLGGDCTMPCGVWASPQPQNGWQVRAVVLDQAGDCAQASCHFPDLNHDDRAIQVVSTLVENGVDSILDRLGIKRVT